MTENKYILPEFFTFLYFADIFTSLIALFMWGDNSALRTVYLDSLLNTIAYWILFKIAVYLMIWLVFHYLRIKFAASADAVITSITIIYAIMLLNNMSGVMMSLPYFNLTPEFLSSIETGRVHVIP